MSDYNQNPYSSPPPPQPPSAGYGYPGPNSPYQGGYPAAPPVQPYPVGPYGMGAQPRNGLGTAGMVCGIIGAVFSWIYFLAFLTIVLGILGIIFGGVGRARVTRGEATNRGAATAGIVLGIVALALPILLIILVASAVTSL